MAQKNRALEKEIKEMIKSLNKQTGAKLSYTNLYDDIKSALEPHMAASRDDELVGVYTRGLSALSDKLLERHSLIVSNPVLRKKYKGDPAETYTITVASNQINSLMAKIIELVDPDFSAGFVWSEKQLNTFRDFEQGALKGRTLYEEWPKCIKGWDHECFYKDIETIDNTFNTVELSNDKYKFDKRRGNEKDVKVAELYYKSKIIKDEVDSYGFFRYWFNRIFNSKLMNAYDAFVQKANETLASVGFDEKKHGNAAESMLYGKIMPPHELDIKHVEVEREQRDVQQEQKTQNVMNKGVFEYRDNMTEEEIQQHIESMQQDAIAFMKQEVEKYNKDNGASIPVEVTIASAQQPDDQIEIQPKIQPKNESGDKSNGKHKEVPEETMPLFKMW